MRPASAALICAAVPAMLTLALPLPVTPAPAVTLRMPLDTLSVVVSALLSMSATETPAIGRAVSSATLCAPGTVLTGASFTGLTVIAIRSVSVAVPSLVATVSVSPPLKLRLPV